MYSDSLCQIGLTVLIDRPVGMALQENDQRIVAKMGEDRNPYIPAPVQEIAKVGS